MKKFLILFISVFVLCLCSCSKEDTIYDSQLDNIYAKEYKVDSANISYNAYVLDQTNYYKGELKCTTNCKNNTNNIVEVVSVKFYGDNVCRRGTKESIYLNSNQNFTYTFNYNERFVHGYIEWVIISEGHIINQIINIK